MQVTLINPNTNAATTAQMVEIAQAACPDLSVEGITAPFGAPLITTPAQLDQAAQSLCALLPRLQHARAVIIAAFGDPALEQLRAHLPCPVIGLAEAAMAEGGAGDTDGQARRFAVVTTTPDLVDRIALRAAGYGHPQFAGTWITPGPPAQVMADPEHLTAALEAACLRAIHQGRAEAIVIGGGPLSQAAHALAGRLPVPVIAPVPAAMRHVRAQLQAQQT